MICECWFVQYFMEILVDKWRSMMYYKQALERRAEENIEAKRNLKNFEKSS